MAVQFHIREMHANDAFKKEHVKGGYNYPM